MVEHIGVIQCINKGTTKTINYSSAMQNQAVIRLFEVDYHQL